MIEDPAGGGAKLVSHRFVVLDIARSLASLWVLGAHFSILTGQPIFLLSQGRLPVEMFIFISGFLMCEITRKSKDPRKLWESFYIRRFFRIAPSFFLAVCLYWCLGDYLSVAFSDMHEKSLGLSSPISPVTANAGLGTLGLHFLFLHGIFPAHAGGIFGPAWSLSLEVQFYLIAPWIMAWQRWRPITLLVACAVINLIANRLFGTYGSDGLCWNYFYPSFLPNRIFLFLFGAIVCHAYHERGLRSWKLLVISGVVVAGLFGAKTLVVTAPLAGAVLLWPWLSAVFPRITTACERSKFVDILAEYSYGIYLYHIMAIGVCWMGLRRSKWLTEGDGFSTAERLWLLLIVVAVTLAISGFIFHFLEKPFRRVGARLANKLPDDRK